MEDKDIKDTRTTSFRLAAYLMACGHTLLCIEPSDDRRRKIFVLQGNNTSELTSDFYKDSKVRRFMEAERMLKERLYSGT